MLAKHANDVTALINRCKTIFIKSTEKLIPVNRDEQHYENVLNNPFVEFIFGSTSFCFRERLFITILYGAMQQCRQTLRRATLILAHAEHAKVFEFFRW